MLSPATRHPLLQGHEKGNGQVTHYAYHNSGGVARVTKPTGAKVMLKYNGLGRTLTRTVVTDAYPDGLATRYSYTPRSQLATATYPNVTDAVTGDSHTLQLSYTYGPDGYLTKTVASDIGGTASRTTSYGYGARGHVTEVTDAKDRVTTYG
ncbi:MAG: hypothetical protein ACRDQA_29555, partial [Nocardioidaceae bacterium]